MFPKIKLNLFLQLFYLLSTKQKYQICLIVVLMLIVSALEVVSIGAVLPLLGALISPEKVFNHNLLNSVFLFFNIAKPEQIVFPIIFGFCLVIVFAGSMRWVLLFCLCRFSLSLGSDLSHEVYRRTLYQPYIVHVKRNSSDVIAGIISKITMLIGSVVTPCLIFFSSLSAAIAIFVTLFLVNAQIATIVFGVLGLVYFLIYLGVRKRLRHNSTQISIKTAEVVKKIQEGLGGVRDVLLDGSQSEYCKAFRAADYPLREAQAQNVLISGTPKYLVETVSIVLLVLLTFSFSQSHGDIIDLLPVIGALVLGAQRLLPVLQQVYSSYTTMSGAETILRDSLDLLRQPMPKSSEKQKFDTLAFQDKIELHNVAFQYEEQGPSIITDISLSVPKGSFVGVVGKTGTGKSTFIDILMGLLHPTRGELRVDGVKITRENIFGWHQNVAHVPQNIFLIDGSISENIAFGTPLSEINHALVEEAARRAMIWDVITALPDKMSTRVGERGIKMSGGQRQRLGIARAFYKQSTVLFFDEATNSLDSKTESKLLTSLHNTSSNTTIFMVAHQLSTLQDCDFIVKINADGRCKICSFEQILAETE